MKKSKIQQFNVGDRVLILGAKHISYLKNRLPRYGIITKIDGAYINVRPSWCHWEMECYENEIKLANK